MIHLLNNLTSLSVSLLGPSAVFACSSEGDALGARSTGSVNPGTTQHRNTAAIPVEFDRCLDGDDGGQRLNDLAEHVYDGATANYLFDN